MGIAWGHFAPAGFKGYARKWWNCPADGTYTLSFQAGNKGQALIDGKGIVSSTGSVRNASIRLSKGPHKFDVAIMNAGATVPTPIWFNLWLKDSTGRTVLQADSSWSKSPNPESKSVLKPTPKPAPRPKPISKLKTIWYPTSATVPSWCKPISSTPAPTSTLTPAPTLTSTSVYHISPSPAIQFTTTTTQPRVILPTSTERKSTISQASMQTGFSSKSLWPVLLGVLISMSER